MAGWKQILIAMVVICLGGVLWLKFYPGAGAILASHGLSDPFASPVEAAAAPAQDAQGGNGQGGGGQRGGRVTTVVVKAAGSDIINDRVQALGTGIARQTVTILPQASGTLTEVLIHSGATVAAGDVMARLDSETQAIARDKAKLALDDARMTLERNQQLARSNVATASQTQAAELAEHVAQLSLRSAEQDLAERTITAPISGVVGIVNVTPGNEVTTQTVIANVIDNSALLVNFWLPERLVGTVALADAVTLVPVSRPQDSLTAKVAAIDNSVDPASGTFQLQAEVDNQGGSLRPGMAFSVTMKFGGDSFIAVDPLSVQWGSGGAYVWRVTEGKTEKVNVRIVQRNTESVLVAGEIAEGDAVVTEGIDGLKAGADVQIAGAPKTEAKAETEEVQAAAKVPAEGAKPAASN